MPEKIDLGDAKTLGLIGAILILIGLFTAFIVSIVGIILTYIAISKISSKLNEPMLKNYYLYFILFAIIGFIVFIAGIIIAFGSLFLGLFTGIPHQATGFKFMDIVAKSFGILALSFIAFYILLILSGLNLRKTYDSLKKYSGVDLFGTTGFLYFLGSILLIILVGALLIFIACILNIIAWAQLPEAVALRRDMKEPATPASLI